MEILQGRTDLPWLCWTWPLDGKYVLEWVRLPTRRWSLLSQVVDMALAICEKRIAEDCTHWSSSLLCYLSHTLHKTHV